MRQFEQATERDFIDGFVELFKKWENEWTPIGHLGRKAGPFKILAGGRYLTKEHLALQEPEEQARKKLEEYCAQFLVDQAALGYEEEALDLINHAMSERIGMSDYKDFVRAVVTKAFRLMRGSKMLPDLVAVTIAEQHLMIKKNTEAKE